MNINMNKIREKYKASAKPVSQELIEKTMLAMAVRHKPRINTSRRYKWSVIIPFAMLITLMVTTISAAAVFTFKLMKAGEVADIMGDQVLSTAFDSEDALNINVSVTSSGYTFTLLSIISGKDLRDETYYNSNAIDDRTYAVVAIQNADGTPFDAEQQMSQRFFVSPLVKGLKPWLVNIVTMNGGYFQTVVDGVIYRLAECDTVAMFADRGLYFAVSTGDFYSNDAFIYNEDSGEIMANPNYSGVSIVFDLPLDKSLANPEKAEEYLQSIDYYWTPQSEINNNKSETDNKIVESTQINDIMSDVENREKIYSSNIPTTWNEWNMLSTEEQAEFISNINWDNAKSLAFTRQELTVDSDGMIIYSYIFFNKDGTIHSEVNASVPFKELFEDNQTAQSKIAGKDVSGSEDDTILIRGVRLSINENGKVTGEVVFIPETLYTSVYVPSTYNEFAEMSIEDKHKFLENLDWDKGIPIDGSFRELTVDADGMLRYEWKVYNENGEIINGGDSVTKFEGLFEDNKVSQSTMANGFGAAGQNNSAILTIQRTRYSIDESGKISAVTLEMICPFAMKQLFIN